MNQRKSPGRLVSTGVVFLLLSLIVVSGCTTARIPVAGLEVPIPDIPLPAVLRGENDLRGRTWSKAFEILHGRLVREYAYGEHKGMDWDGLYERFSAEVRVAEENTDKAGWYRALRGYIHSIPDGNMNIDLDETIRDGEVGASAGLVLAKLADGRVIVVGLLEDGPAALSEIHQGATVLTWDGQPIIEALAGANIVWVDNPAATPSGRLLQQLDWVTRGAADSDHEIEYLNPGQTTPSTATLTLTQDDYDTLPLSRPLWEPVELFSSPIEHRTLEGEYHYIRVAAIAPTLSTPFPSRDFKVAIRQAVDQEAPGLILDLRGTQGGDNTMVPTLLGALVSEGRFFETPSTWDREFGQYLVDSEDTVLITPADAPYTGHVVVLVDGYTMGPAESMVDFLAEQENVRVFGPSGTHGSPGVPGMELTLPGGYAVMYPTRRSLDEAGQIQGVSDAAGVGTVVPDAVFALDDSSATAIFETGTDNVLEKAVEMLDSSTWRFP